MAIKMHHFVNPVMNLMMIMNLIMRIFLLKIKIMRV